MSNVINEGVCQCAGAGDLRETSVPSSQFCYKPKTALKTCLPKKKKKKEIRDYGAKNNKKGKKHRRNMSGSLSIQTLCYFLNLFML